MKFLVIVILSTYSFFATAQVRLNEMQSSNSSTITDEYGENEDWVEIHNPTTDTIEIGGLVFKDQLDTWAIPTGDPSTLLNPGDYFLLWADDQPGQGIFHTNFKLASGGEFLGLYENDSVTVIDSVTIPGMNSDYSLIRCDFGWLTSNTPSPLAINNCTTGLGEINNSEKVLHITSNENGSFTLNLLDDSFSHSKFSLFSIDGKKVIDLDLNGVTTILNNTLLNSGIYYAVISNSEIAYSEKIWIGKE
jgi:hypothetical protein